MARRSRNRTRPTAQVPVPRKVYPKAADVLSTPELGMNICRYLVLEEGSKSASCRALQQTSSALYNVALDAIWRESTNFAGLAKFFQDPQVVVNAKNADEVS